MNEDLHPAFFELIGKSELPTSPIFAHQLAGEVRDKKRQVIDTFDPNTRSILTDRNQRAGILFLGSYGLVALVTGINEGYAHIATEQIQDLRGESMAYGVHPLIAEEPSWRDRERRIVQMLYEQGFRSYSSQTTEGRELDHYDMARYFSALIELSIESFRRTSQKEEGLPGQRRMGELMVRESALTLLTSTELAVQQIWSEPETLRGRLGEIIETYEQRKNWKDTYGTAVATYIQRGILKLFKFDIY